MFFTGLLICYELKNFSLLVLFFPKILFFFFFWLVASHQIETGDSRAGTELLDIILTKVRLCAVNAVSISFLRWICGFS
jgi:hypothetical protein